MLVSLPLLDVSACCVLIHIGNKFVPIHPGCGVVVKAETRTTGVVGSIPTGRAWACLSHNEPV